eukprot:1184006-Prorocentrum_minimum.AAC.1
MRWLNTVLMVHFTVSVSSPSGSKGTPFVSSLRRTVRPRNDESAQYILSPLVRLAPATGIFSLPLCDWYLLRTYSLPSGQEWRSVCTGERKYDTRRRRRRTHRPIDDLVLVRLRGGALEHDDHLQPTSTHLAKSSLSPR